MNRFKVSMMTAASLLVGCAVTSIGPEFKGSELEVDKAGQVCSEHIKNEPLAKKMCFPMISGIPLTVRVTGVEDMYTLTINSIVSTNHSIECVPNEADTKLIRAKPEMVEVGATYEMRGQVESFRSSQWMDGNGPRYTFKLGACKFKMISHKRQK